MSKHLQLVSSYVACCFDTKSNPSQFIPQARFDSNLCLVGLFLTYNSRFIYSVRSLGILALRARILPSPCHYHTSRTIWSFDEKLCTNGATLRTMPPSLPKGPLQQAQNPLGAQFHENLAFQKMPFKGQSECPAIWAAAPLVALLPPSHLLAAFHQFLRSISIRFLR